MHNLEVVLYSSNGCIWIHIFHNLSKKLSPHLANLLALLSQKAGEEMDLKSSQTKWSDLCMFSIS